MGSYDKNASSSTGRTESSGDIIIEVMLDVARASMEEGMPERAFNTYKQIVMMTPNVTAQYNLGSLYAQGKGTKRNYLQASYWFRQASLNGDADAEKMRIKTMMDYIHEGLAEKTSMELYQEMIKYAKLLYPREDERSIAAENLYNLGRHYFNKKEYGGAMKLLRAASEFGNYGEAQNCLGVLYNLGAGIRQNDLAALYWFDRAADNGVQLAVKDRNGILNAYRTNYSSEEFEELMQTLGSWCSIGTANVPQDLEKAIYWRLLASQRELD